MQYRDSQGVEVLHISVQVPHRKGTGGTEEEFPKGKSCAYATSITYRTALLGTCSTGQGCSAASYLQDRDTRRLLPAGLGYSATWYPAGPGYSATWYPAVPAGQDRGFRLLATCSTGVLGECTENRGKCKAIRTCTSPADLTRVNARLFEMHVTSRLDQAKFKVYVVILTLVVDLPRVIGPV